MTDFEKEQLQQAVQANISRPRRWMCKYGDISVALHYRDNENKAMVEKYRELRKLAALMLEQKRQIQCNYAPVCHSLILSSA